MFLFLEQYPGVLMAAALQYISKSDTIRKSLLLFALVQDHFGYSGLLWFFCGEIIAVVVHSVKNAIGIMMCSVLYLLISMSSRKTVMIYF